MAKFKVILCEKIEDYDLFKVAFSIKSDRQPDWSVGQKAWSLSEVKLEVGSILTHEDDSYELQARKNQNGDFRVVEWV